MVWVQRLEGNRQQRETRPWSIGQRMASGVSSDSTRQGVLDAKPALGWLLVLLCVWVAVAGLEALTKNENARRRNKEELGFERQRIRQRATREGICCRPPTTAS
jgi:hypothetical protein